jgi:hypothetical protein
MARAPRHRKFYELPPAAAPEAEEVEGVVGLAEYIRNSVIGADATFLRCSLGVACSKLYPPPQPLREAARGVL